MIIYKIFKGCSWQNLRVSIFFSINKNGFNSESHLKNFQNMNMNRPMYNQSMNQSMSSQNMPNSSMNVRPVLSNYLNDKTQLTTRRQPPSNMVRSSSRLSEKIFLDVFF